MKLSVPGKNGLRRSNSAKMQPTDQTSTKNIIMKANFIPEVEYSCQHNNNSGARYLKELSNIK